LRGAPLRERGGILPRSARAQLVADRVQAPRHRSHADAVPGISTPPGAGSDRGCRSGEGDRNRPRDRAERRVGDLGRARETPPHPYAATANLRSTPSPPARLRAPTPWRTLPAFRAECHAGYRGDGARDAIL